jgi:hypothetical protein
VLNTDRAENGSHAAVTCGRHILCCDCSACLNGGNDD